MKKVIICSESPANTGGVRVWARTLMNFYSEHGDEMAFKLYHFSTTRSTPLSQFVPWHSKWCSIIKDYWKLPFKLIKVIRSENSDVVHIVSVGNLGLLRDILFLLIAKLYHNKGVVHFHFGRIPAIRKSKGVEWYMLYIVLKMANGIIVLDQKSFESVSDIIPSKLFKIGNSYSDELNYFRAKELQRSYRKILFVGHVVPEKGIMELLEAVCEIDKIDLYVYGPTNDLMMKSIDEFLLKHPFAGNLFFKGLKPSSVIYEELSNSGLFVLPTYTEGFPLIIMEAMVCGCPIITTPVGAIEEILQLDKELLGYLVPVKDVQSLKRQVMYCLDKREEAFEKALKARKKALKMYSTSTMVNHLENMWESVLNQ